MKQIGVFAVGISALVNPMVAQQPASVERVVAERVTGVASDINQVLVRPITVRLVRVPVKEALAILATQANVSIQYQGQVFDGVNTVVTLQGEKLPLGAVLEHLLAGTGLQAMPFANDGVTIVRTSGERSVRQGTLIGKIIHAKTKRPVSGASILAGEPPRSVTSDEQGAFRLSVAPGEHEIQVRSVGLGRQVRKVTVAEGETVTLEFALEPNVSVLNEVIVTGTVIATERKAIPTPITVIQGEELERRGITRIEQLMRGEIPGVLVLDRGAQAYSNESEMGGVSSRVYSRGSADLSGGANPIKTYVDGVELLDASYLGTIDPRNIEKIEIITGPQAATIYGSGAMGGVMQIFTKKGSNNGMPEVILDLRYGVLENSFSNGKTPEHHDALTLRGGSGPAFSYSGTLSYDYSGQWQPNLFDRRMGASLGISHTRGPLTASTSLRVTNGTRGTWAVTPGLGQPNYGLLDMFNSGVSVISAYPVSVFRSGQVSTSSNQTVSIDVSYRLLPFWQHNATVGRSQNTFRLKPISPTFVTRADTLFMGRRSNGERITWNYNNSLVNRLGVVSSALTIGANGSTGDMLSLSGCQVSSIAQAIVGCRTGDAPTISVPLNQKSTGGFASWQVGLFQKIFTTFGVRMEQNPSYGRRIKFDVTPTNGLTYTWEYEAISLKLMGSYGRATRPPKDDQRLEVVQVSPSYEPSRWISRLGNPDLRPEYSRGPQGGFELYVGNLGSLAVNHYQQTVTDLVLSVVADSFEALREGSPWIIRQTQFRNIAKVRQQGWEATGSTNIGSISAKGTYSWSDSRILYVDEQHQNSYKTGQAFTGLPTHTGNVVLSYARNRTNVTFVMNYVGDAIQSFTDERLWYETKQSRIPMYGVMCAMYVEACFREAARNVPGYTKGDLTGSHRLTPQATLMVNIVNIGNRFESDSHSDLNPSLGRQTTVGISYRFGGR